MTDDTLAKIEARIKGSDAINEDKRRELQDLLAKLRAEVSNLAETRPEQAQSITQLTDISTKEATRREEKILRFWKRASAPWNGRWKNLRSPIRDSSKSSMLSAALSPIWAFDS